jgi:hypothetical protein
MINTNIAIGALLFVIGHVLAWYTHNLQFVSDFWKNKPILSNILFGLPCGLIYWYGTKYIMVEMEELWSSRFIAFSSVLLNIPYHDVVLLE